MANFGKNYLSWNLLETRENWLGKPWSPKKQLLVAIPRKEHHLLCAFLDLNEKKLAEISNRPGRNTTGHREKDVHKDRKVVDGDERNTISEIAGRKSTLVPNIPENC